MIGDNFFFLNSVDSTNNYAMGRVHAALAKHGEIYLAREQTAGRGQRGKDWQTAAGENITLTIVLETKQLLFSSQFNLSAGIALAVSDLVEEKVKSDVTIKWPNDIYWRDRKAGGILIENVLQGAEWKWSIAGIGLNVNQVNFDGRLSNPVSLKQVTGKHFDIDLLAKQLATAVERRWHQLLTEKPEKLLEEYNERLFRKGERVRLKKNNVHFETIVKQVNQAGELVTEDSGIHHFSSGEVQWVL